MVWLATGGLFCLLKRRAAVALLAASLLPATGYSADTVNDSAVGIDDMIDDDESLVDEVPQKNVTGTPSAAPIVSGSAGVLSDSADTRSWEIPPIPWRGALSVAGGASQAADGSTSTSLNQSFSASADSYVWQPWFLKLNGGMSAARSEQQSESTSVEATSVALNGGGLLLPSTRYPFSFTGSLSKNISDSQSETAGNLVSEVQSSTLGLTQIYIPEDRLYSSTWSYNQINVAGTTTTDGRSENSLDLFSQNFGVNVAVPLRTENPQSLNLGSSFGSSKNKLDQSSSQTGSIDAGHSIYLEDYVMSISTNLLASATKTAAFTDSSRSSVTNLSSSLSWIPSDDYPLEIGSGLNFFDTKSGSGVNEYRVSTANVMGSARYPLDKYWTFQTQANVVQVSALGVGAKTTSNSQSLTANVTWVGEGVRSKWGLWDYALSYGGGSGLNYFSMKSAGATQASNNVMGSANLGHSLGRSYTIEDDAPVLVSFSQGYSAGLSGSDSAGLAHALSHSATASWSPTTELTRKFFTGSISDGRSFGEYEQSTQQITTSASYQTAITPYSSLSGFTGMSYSQQSGQSGGRSVFGANAGARYSHFQFANVSGLNYEARYDLVLRQPENLSERHMLEHLISQGWSWRYGLLGWRVDHTLSRLGSGDVTQSINLSIVRDFSGVL